MEGPGYVVRRTFLELDPVPEQEWDERPARRGRSYSDSLLDVFAPPLPEAEELKVERRGRAESCMDTILQKSEPMQRSPKPGVIQKTKAVEDEVTSGASVPILKRHAEEEEEDLAGASTAAETCKDSWRCTEQIASSGEESGTTVDTSTRKAAPSKSVPVCLHAHLDPPSTARPRAMTEGAASVMPSMLPPPCGPGQVFYMLTVGSDGSQVLVPVAAPSQAGWASGLPAAAAGTGSACLEARAVALQAYAKEVKEEARRAKAAAAAARRRTLEPTAFAPAARSVARGRTADVQLHRASASKQKRSAPAPPDVAGTAKAQAPDDSADSQDTMSVQEEIVKSVAAAGKCDAEDEIENDDRTTLMFRNLPNNYTRTHLLDMLDSEGFKGYYSFVYLPTDFKNFAGFGYAFLNFAKHEWAVKAKQHFQGFKQWRVPSRKVCDVVWSGPVQGLAAHTERYRNSPVMHESVPDEYKPVAFVDGVRVPFPAPTKRIRPPRVRHGIATDVQSSDQASGAREARRGGDAP